MNATSDDDVFDDYGDLLSERGRERAETNIFFSRRWDAWNLVANILWYQDLTVRRPVELQRVPEVRLRGIRQPVPGLSPLLYEVESSLVNFMRHVGPEGLRVDVHPRLVLPIPIAGVVTVTPWVGGRLTYYDQRATGERITKNGGILVENSVTDHRVRQQVEVGVDAETRLSRVYTLDPGGRVAALQHVIEPRASFVAVRGLEQKAYPHYEPTVSRIGVLRSMDPNIDRLGKVNAVEYALTNRLNAKTTAGPGQEAVRWEAARLTVAQIYDITRAIRDDEPFKDVRAELEVRPTPAFSIRADAAWNVNGLGLREVNTDIAAIIGPVSAAIGTRFNEVADHAVVRDRRGIGPHHAEPRRPGLHRLGRPARPQRRDARGIRPPLPVLGYHGRVRQSRRQGGRGARVDRTPRHRTDRHQVRVAVRTDRHHVRVAAPMIPQLDLTRQHAALREELLAAAARVLDSCRFILGPEGRALESELAAFCGARHGIGVNSGTDALLLGAARARGGAGRRGHHRARSPSWPPRARSCSSARPPSSSTLSRTP